MPQQSARGGTQPQTSGQSQTNDADECPPADTATPGRGIGLVRLNPAHLSLGGVATGALAALLAFALTAPGPSNQARATAPAVRGPSSSALELPAPGSTADMPQTAEEQMTALMFSPRKLDTRLISSAGTQTGPRIYLAALGEDKRPADAANKPAMRPMPDVPVARPNVELSARNLIVKPGDTFAKMLSRAKIPPKDIFLAAEALGKSYNLRRLKVGQKVSLKLAEVNGTIRLQQLRLDDGIARRLEVFRNDFGGFSYKETLIPLKKRLVRRSGRIDSSLYLAAKRAGLPEEALARLVRVLSYDIDFQRDIQPGDSFDVLFEEYTTRDGRIAKIGDILVASLKNRSKTLTYYRYTPKDDGFADYFDAKGHSVKKTLMRTPVNGARLSSGFGMRRHPILGYTRMHKGIDFAAPRGTPIMAAGDGVIEYAGRKGGYGIYVRIRHNGTYKTAYAHMKALRRGIYRGKRVRQGDIIGYVGSTGRSTGPHLHYEVLVNNRQVNPRSVKLPTGRVLRGRELNRFKATLGQLRTAMIKAAQTDTVASAEPEGQTNSQ